MPYSGCLTMAKRFTAILFKAGGWTPAKSSIETKARFARDTLQELVQAIQRVFKQFRQIESSNGAAQPLRFIETSSHEVLGNNCLIESCRFDLASTSYPAVSVSGNYCQVTSCIISRGTLQVNALAQDALFDKNRMEGCRMQITR